MKPLKLKPAFKDYIWGGQKLHTIYNKETDLSPVAESWELSCHKDGHSIISGGEYDGKTLDEYIKENPDCLGTSVQGDELPILIKLIDAQDNLSVQVHPEDRLAKEMENQNGKTEMWYVIDAEKDALITYGVKNPVTKEELEEAINKKTLETLLNHVPSKKGDVFFVEAGTIHAIGKGNLIAEIQQNSNVTYRLYDYGRVDKNGNERELHIEKGIMASNLDKTEPKEIIKLDDNTRIIGSCEYFDVKEVKLDGNKTFDADEKSYHAIICVEGSFDISDFSMKVKVGETVFVPAGTGKYTVSGKATLLVTSNPT